METTQLRYFTYSTGGSKSSSVHLRMTRFVFSIGSGTFSSLKYSIFTTSTTTICRASAGAQVLFYPMFFAPLCLTSQQSIVIVQLSCIYHGTIPPCRKIVVLSTRPITKSSCQLNPCFQAFFGIYFCTFDIKTTHSTWLVWICLISLKISRLREYIISLYHSFAVCGNMSINLKVSHFYSSV